MIYAVVPSFCGLGLEDVHVSTFWLLLWDQLDTGKLIRSCILLDHPLGSVPFSSNWNLQKVSAQPTINTTRQVASHAQAITKANVHIEVFICMYVPIHPSIYCSIYVQTERASERERERDEERETERETRLPDGAGRSSTQSRASLRRSLKAILGRSRASVTT